MSRSAPTLTVLFECTCINLMYHLPLAQQSPRNVFAVALHIQPTKFRAALPGLRGLTLPVLFFFGLLTLSSCDIDVGALPVELSRSGNRITALQELERFGGDSLQGLLLLRVDMSQVKLRKLLQIANKGIDTTALPAGVSLLAVDSEGTVIKGDQHVYQTFELDTSLIVPAAGIETYAIAFARHEGSVYETQVGYLRVDPVEK